MNGTPQKGFVRFINQLGMVSFGAFVSQIGWLIAITGFTYTGCRLMLLVIIHPDLKDASAVLSYGFQVIVAVLGALGYKSTVNAAANHGQRLTAQEYAPVIEAKARGKAEGEAQGRAIATAEHAAMAPLVAHADKVDQTVGPAGPSFEDDEEHRWRARQNPTEGLG